MGSNNSSSISDSGSDDSRSPPKKKSKTGLNSNGAISKLHTKLNEFRNEERYCDVTVHIQQSEFKCHRVVLAAVSEYFDMMFNGNFNESTKKEIKLVDIVDAQVFAEILNFAYSGILPNVIESNVFSLLRTAEYLCIREIEDACIEYIQGNLSSIKNVIEILKFAVATNKECLKESLIKHILQHFHGFSQDPKLLELSFEELNMLLTEFRLPLSACTYLRFRDENILLDVLMRWIYHSLEERRSYFEKLSRFVDFEKISTEYKTFLSNNYKIECDDKLSLEKVLSDNLCADVDIDMSCTPLNNYLESPDNNLKLHAFVWYFKDKIRYESMRVFSLNEQKASWSAACNLESYPTVGKLKTIVLESVPDYFFAYSSYKGQNNSEFYTYSSVDFSEKLQRLKCPPCHSHKFGMCGKNYIYWYNSDTFNSSHYENLRQRALNEEQIRRGIYGYQPEQNKWFSLPEMKVQLSDSCITIDDNLVYLIGGSDSDGDIPAGYVQGYDCRTPTWLELPKTCRSYNKAVGCTFNGKVYVSDGVGVEMYNSVAGKWEMISSNTGREVSQSSWFRVQEMIPYKNLLWIFNKFAETCIIDPYEPLANNWRMCRSLLSEVEKHHGHCDSDDEEAYSWHVGKFGKRAPKNLDTTTKLKNVIVFKNL